MYPTNKLALSMLVLSACTLVAGAAQKVSGLSDGDSASIRQVILGFEDSYNRHDAVTLGRWFTEESDFTTTRGVTTHGRNQIEDHFTPLFAGRLKTVHRVLSIRNVRVLRPEVVSVYIDCEVSGAVDDSGRDLPKHKGLYDWILTKEGGRWLIDVFHESDLPSTSPTP
jgi:uncharacterized protein (TIGR02246 family)